ncbi:MAG: hypothetical protein JWM06_3318 [Actinomycetia bacterium]|nr:hypothetical protein [Actinomycetes bacterium]
MRKHITAAASAIAIALPAANAVAAATRSTAATVTPKKKVVTVTKTVKGTQIQAQEWGYIEVTLVVKKTTTTVGTKTTVARKITSVSVPIYPNHTNRSVFINQQALPMLEHEALAAQFTGGINMISGASDSSDAFIQSLQAALLAGKRA